MSEDREAATSEAAGTPSRYMVAMRDGVRLETYVYVPEGRPPWPVLLARCLYGRREPLVTKTHQLVAAGFVVVLQNVRGRHGSEGELPGRNPTPEDGYDTISWLTQQHWCDGQVGTFGNSALAAAQVWTAFMAHPAHKAMSPAVLPFGMMSRLGGAILLHQPVLWYFFSQSNKELRPFEEIDWMQHLKHLPVVDILDKLDGPVEAYRRSIVEPGTYMTRPGKPEQFASLHAANLMVTGWYDHCMTGPIDFFMQTQICGTAAQKQKTHLIIGPWDHSMSQGEYDFGPEAKRDLIGLDCDFFARHLKQDGATPVLPPVRIFVMGRNQWRDENEWPLQRAVPTPWFIHGDGSLSTNNPSDDPPQSFVYDPADPVPTLGGANSGPAVALPMSRGPRDQRPVLDRDDVLLFRSEPLSHAMEVTGPLKMVLYASSSARDTDFTAKLMDIAPDGNARLLTDGVVRARYRHGLDRPQPLEPNEVVRYEIDLWFTSNEFQPGHRIALAISSSNFPRLDRNLNTGGDNHRDTHFITAKQTIFHDCQRPSHLLLPVVPLS